MALGVNNTDLAVLAAVVLGLTVYFKWEFIKELLFSDDSSITANNSGSRDITEVIRANRKNYLVLFASQTGTAEDYAKKFAKELSVKFSLNVMCADVEHYDFETFNSLPEGVPVSLFISTYGEGDFPDGAVHFEQYINEVDPGSLSNIDFTLFGLGNSTYEFFNGAARKAMDALLRAGGVMIGSIGEGDDAAGTTDEDYLSWKEDTLALLKDKLKLDEKEQSFQPSFEFIELDEMASNVSLGEPSYQYLPSNSLAYNADNIQVGPFDVSHPYVAPISFTKELFTSGDRNCIHSEIDISRSNIEYTTGDHLAIWPSNADEKVEQFISLFGLPRKQVFDLRPLDSTVRVPFVCPTTIEAAVRHYLEITGPLSRQLFGALMEFAPTPEAKEKLSILSQDKEKFASEITSKCFNLADGLAYLSNGAKWPSVPWLFLVESLPHLQPRYYSISSSSVAEKETIHITSVVENNPSPLQDGRRVVGVTTNLLRNIQLAQNNVDIASSNLPVHYDLNGPRNLFNKYKLPIHVRHSTFRLPSSPSTPVIMIGPGTGVAPFRGFIRDRVATVEKNPGVKFAKHILFYGSRDTGDYLYQDEWPEYAKKLDGSFEMVVCHSRLPDQPKVYVQDKIREHKDDLLDMLDNGAYIYVCGDAAHMANGVVAAFVDILSKSKNITEAEATQMVRDFRTAGRYQEDIW